MCKDFTTLQVGLKMNLSKTEIMSLEQIQIKIEYLLIENISRT